MTDAPSVLSLIPNNYLKFGIFLAPFHAMNENPTQAMARDMALLEHIDGLGYDEAWIGEHHSGGFEIIACPEVFIAAAAERTRHIRLGTGVVSLPYHNPLTVAGRITQLDHMTRGRVMFGVGPGALVGDAFRMGIDPANQRRMMNESLDVLIPLLDGETVTMKTDWFDLRDAHLQIPPFQQPRTEMAVACARLSPSHRGMNQDRVARAKSKTSMIFRLSRPKVCTLMRPEPDAPITIRTIINTEA